MIEKKIYYFWYGGNLPRYAKSCIESWKRFMPDFEIVKIPEEYIDMNVEWNKKAYKKKNWAYLSDSTRINFLRSHSGIYMDTDMFLCKRIPEDMLNSSLFMGCEHDLWISQGIIGKDKSEKVTELFENWYNAYRKENKIKSSPMIFDLIDKEYYDLKPSKDVYTNKYNMKFYGSKYFDPVRWEKKKPLFCEETVCIDLGTASAIIDSGYSKERIKMFKMQNQNILEFLKTRNCEDLYNRDYTVE